MELGNCPKISLPTCQNGVKNRDKVYEMLLLPTTSHSNPSCISIPLPHFTNNNIEKKGNKLKNIGSTRHGSQTVEDDSTVLFHLFCQVASEIVGFLLMEVLYKIKQTDSNSNFFIN